MQMLHSQKNVLNFIQNTESENQGFFTSKLNQNLWKKYIVENGAKSTE